MDPREQSFIAAANTTLSYFICPLFLLVPPDIFCTLDVPVNIVVHFIKCLIYLRMVFKQVVSACFLDISIRRL